MAGFGAFDLRLRPSDLGIRISGFRVVGLGLCV